MEKKKSEKETEDQKLDKLNNQMEDMKSQFRHLLQALKGDGLISESPSVASMSMIDGGAKSLFSTLTKNINKGNNESEYSSRRSARRAFFDSYEDALVNPTALTKKRGEMERSNTLDNDKVKET